MKLLNGEEIETFFYFLIVIVPFVIIRILKYIKEIYSLREYVLIDSKLIINQIEYPLENIALRYIYTAPSTLLAAELFEKENQKVIGLFIINCWAGNILNITSETLDKIFEKKILSNIQTDAVQSSRSIKTINMQKEEQEIKQFDNAWYLVYGVFLIPIALILYLMVGN